MRFDLNAPSLASYHWGTMFCQFSSAAPVTKQLFPRLAAMLMAETAPWDTDLEFRTITAFLHELVHLAQDLTTGLGHADFITHCTSTKDLMFYAAVVVHMDGAAARPPYRRPGEPPWFEDNEDPIVAEAHDRLRYYPFAALPQGRRERLRALVAAALGKPIADEALFELSTQSLLEADAVIGVARPLVSLRMTAAQQEVLVRNAALLDGAQLGPEYWNASGHLVAVLSHHAQLRDSELGAIQPRMFGLLVDSALAYPPRSWIVARGEDPDEYDPCVKYVRLLAAFQQLAGAAMDRFWKALLVGHGNLLEAEAILREHTSFQYPSAREIYEAWVAELEPLKADHTAAAVRQDACRKRLEHGALIQRRGLALLFTMQLPVLYLDPRAGFVKHDWNLRGFDPDQSHGLTLELVDHFMIMELADFLFRTGEYRCPHARAGICPAVEDGCASGLTHLAQLPSAPGCRARQLLDTCGMRVPG